MFRQKTKDISAFLLSHKFDLSFGPNDHVADCADTSCKLASTGRVCVLLSREKVRINCDMIYLLFISKWLWELKKGAGGRAEIEQQTAGQEGGNLTLPDLFPQRCGGRSG